MDIEADEKVEGNVGLEAGGVDAKQLEDLSLVVRVEEDEAVEEGEKEVEEDKDDQLQALQPTEEDGHSCHADICKPFGLYSWGEGNYIKHDTIYPDGQQCPTFLAP